jgi:hypothetical protein
MIVTRDLWLSLTSEKRVETISEALTELKEIDTPKSKLKTKYDQGRLTNVKKDLETFVVNAVGWESERQLSRRY